MVLLPLRDGWRRPSVGSTAAERYFMVSRPISHMEENSPSAFFFLGSFLKSLSPQCNSWHDVIITLIKNQSALAPVELTRFERRLVKPRESLATKTITPTFSTRCLMSLRHKKK